jgi:hypothetical protein
MLYPANHDSNQASLQASLQDSLHASQPAYLVWCACLRCGRKGAYAVIATQPCSHDMRVLTGWTRDMPRDMLRPQSIGAPCRPLPCIALGKIALGTSALGGWQLRALRLRVLLRGR